MDLRFVVPFALSFIISWLALIIHRKSREHFAFIMFVISVGLWSFTLGMFYTADTPALIEFWGRMVYVAGTFIASFFYNFTLVFSQGKINTWRYILTFVPAVFLAYIYLFTDLFVATALSIGAARGYIYGNARPVFDIFFDLYFLAGFLTLWKGYHSHLDPEKKRQYIFFLNGTMLGTLLAASTNIFFQFLIIFEYLWAGPIGAGIWVAILTYGILRYRILNLQIIATQFFISVMWLLLVINVFIFNNRLEFLFNILILFLALVFGYLLIQSVMKTVEQKEELQLLNNRLAQANKELHELDRVKSEFISIASHQLRTPLTSIKGYLSMALEGMFGQLSLGLQEKLSRAYAINERLIRLVNDLLDVSKIEQGRIEYKFEDIDFVSFLRKIAGDFEVIIREQNLRFIIDIPPSLPPVYGDEQKLYHVFGNLLDNAMHYTTSGSITLRAELKPEDKILRVSVKDTGIGLEPEDMSRLFTKFSRGHIGSHIHTEGAGLGLFVAKRIVEDHGGKIWAESEGRGKGSTFFVELPIQRKI